MNSFASIVCIPFYQFSFVVVLTALLTRGPREEREADRESKRESERPIERQREKKIKGQGEKDLGIS